MKRRIIFALALMAILLAGTAAAQHKRLPVRTEEIPDTESGRPAAGAEHPSFKGRLMIYGPPELPLGAPPGHIKPAPKTEPVAEPEPKPEPAPAPSAAPAPIVAPPPAPVATPKPALTPQPAQIAVPAPTPPPAPVVVVPAPAPPPAPVVVVPAPAPPPAPVATPKPALTPPPAQIAVPAPTPLPAPVVVVPAPTPPPAAAPAAVVSAPREPIVRKPVVRPEPARPAAPAARARPEVALAAPSSASVPAAPVPIDAKLIESIFFCLSPGLPQDWKRAWVEITDQGGGKEKNSKFRVSNISDSKDEGEPLVPCNARELTGRIVGLNDKLPPDRRAWTRALLVIDSDGEYELTYDYAK